MRPIIYPYKFGSRSARALSEELRRRGHRAKRVRADGNYRPYRNHVIINWGNSTAPQSWTYPLRDVGMYGVRNVLNPDECIGMASNKLTALTALQEAGVSIPEFTTDRNEAIDWCRLHGTTIVQRNNLSGHSGNGIIIHTPEPELIVDINYWTAPLYVKYIKKAEEYRVHVFKDQVIDIQQKRKRRELDAEDVNYQIRSYNNGWVFCRDEILPPDGINDLARNAVRALGLDFGAVDIIYNKHHDKLYVLEINTAPGLEGTTVIKYADAIEEYL